MLFVTYLATLNLSYPTIKVYLSAISSLHTASVHHNDFNTQLTPRLQQVLKVIQKEKAGNSTPRVHQPITAYIMRQVKAELLKDQHSYYNILMWAACSLAFFGFLRSIEFTVPCQDLFNEEAYLSLGDLSVDSRAAPQLLRVTMKQSKTDPFRKGVTLTLGKTGNFLCPVEAILPYEAQGLVLSSFSMMEEF